MSAIAFAGATSARCLFLARCQTDSKHRFCKTTSLLFPDPGKLRASRNSGVATPLLAEVAKLSVPGGRSPACSRSMTRTSACPFRRRQRLGVVAHVGFPARVPAPPFADRLRCSPREQRLERRVCCPLVLDGNVDALPARRSRLPSMRRGQRSRWCRSPSSTPLRLATTSTRMRGWPILLLPLPALMRLQARAQLRPSPRPARSWRVRYENLNY